MKALRFILPIVMAITAGHKIYGQGAAVVTDPGSYGYLAENAQIAAQQAETLEKQVTFMEQMREAVSKVNSGIQTLSMIDRIIMNEKNLLNTVRNTYSSLEKSGHFTPSELGMIMASFTNILSDFQYNMKLATSVLENDLFKMNDSERLKILTDAQTKSALASNNATALGQKYDRVMQKRQLIKTFGN